MTQEIEVIEKILKPYFEEAVYNMNVKMEDMNYEKISHKAATDILLALKKVKCRQCKNLDLVWLTTYRSQIFKLLSMFLDTIKPKWGKTKEMLQLYGEICEWGEALGHKINEAKNSKERE